MKFLIVNADDFGYSRGINRGIVEAHERGVVTSTSLIVNGLAAEEAVRLSARLPELSLGIHVNFTNEAERLVDFDDLGICRSELLRQIELFKEMTGRLPTHLNSHQHVHRDEDRLPIFREAAAAYGLHLRDAPPVVFKGGFYAQWEYGVTDLSKVSLSALERILRDELGDGISELACHPGYYDPTFECVYHKEREAELETLCDPRLRDLLAELSIVRIGYRELNEVLSRLQHAC